MKVMILEDKVTHYRLIERGVAMVAGDHEVVKVDIDRVIENIKTDQLTVLEPGINLFIIDVSLEKEDELGLRFLRLLNEEVYNSLEFKFIVCSVWERDEFEERTFISDKQFVNKNNFDGFELSYEIRNKINGLF